jgi:hypothetical protein
MDDGVASEAETIDAKRYGKVGKFVDKQDFRDRGLAKIKLR